MKDLAQAEDDNASDRSVISDKEKTKVFLFLQFLI